MLTCGILAVGCKVKERDASKAGKRGKAHGFTHAVAQRSTAHTGAKKQAVRVKTPEEEALWGKARAVLINHDKNHFQHRHFFAVTDPGRIDPILQAILDRKYDGRLTEKNLTHVTARAGGPYGTLKWTPEGRAFLEERLEAHYANPPTTVVGRQLIVDYGIGPGKFEEAGRRGWNILKTRVGLGTSWKGAEVATAFKRLARLHKEPVIVLKIRIPVGSETHYWSYLWIRPQDRIAVKRGDMPTRVYVTGKLDGNLDPFISGEKSLQPKDLKMIRLNDMIWGDEKDAPI